MSNRNHIRDLHPAAARLLLAWLSATMADSYEDIVIRSGITECRTLVEAREELKVKGFLTVIDGKEYASLSRPPDMQSAGTSEQRVDRVYKKGAYTAAVIPQR